MVDVLFISFEFPPLNIGGVFRPFKFVKYLPEFGIRPTVYTLNPDDYGKVFNKVNIDKTVLKELEGLDYRLKPISIDKLEGENDSRIVKFCRIYFNIYRGNEFKKWKRHLFRQLKIDKENIPFKAVFITAPPFGMLELGFQISRMLNLPLIIDMRDAWSYWNTTPYGSIFHYWATIRRERKYFNAAASIIGTSLQTLNDWKILHPDIPENKFHCITNGFDPEQLQLDKGEILMLPLEKGRKFKIVYVGSFYYSPDARRQMLEPRYKKRGHRILQYFPRVQDWKYRSPYFFFKAIAKIFSLKPEWKDNLQIEFAGNKESWLDDMVKEFGLEKNVIHHGFVSHSRSLELQKNADALLITSAKVLNGKDCFIAGKTFEYITMGKPVLAFLSDGSQKDILAETGLSVMFDPDDETGSALKMIELFSKGSSFTPNVAYINNFQRRKLAGQLADLINSVNFNNTFA